MKKIKSAEKSEITSKKRIIKEDKSSVVKYTESIERLTNSELIAFKKEVKTEMDTLRPMCLPGMPPIPEFIRFLNIYKKLTDEFNKRLNKLSIF
jgi:hypothetical protein